MKGKTSRRSGGRSHRVAYVMAVLIITAALVTQFPGFTSSVSARTIGNNLSPGITRSGAPLTLDYPSYGEVEVNISGHEVEALKPGTYGNITISGNGTVKVLGRIEINGMIRISGNGTMDTRSAEVVIRPPPIGRDDNVIRVQDAGTLLIQKGSTFEVYPQPVTELDRMDRNNASFVEVDDTGRIMIQDSTFSATLPGDVVPEDTRVTGGTILITGHGSFISERSTINAYLNYTTIHDTTINSTYVILERWFFMSSQRYGEVRIENSTCTLHEPGQTIFKPTNGNIIIKNSTIYGNVRPETISMFHISDSEIHAVNDQAGYATIHEAIELNDNAVGVVERTSLHGYIKLGWSSTNEFLGKADASVKFIDCTFDTDRFDCFANTSVTLEGCSFTNTSLAFEISDRSRLHLISTDLDLLAVECGTVQQLKDIKEDIWIIMEGSTISILQSVEEDVRFNLDLRNGSSIDLFRVHSDGSYQNKTVKAVMSSGSNIFFENGSSANIEVVLRNSPPPLGDRNENFTLLRRYVISGTATINGIPIPGIPVIISDDGVLATAVTDDMGRYSIPYDTDIEGGGIVIQHLSDRMTLNAVHLGFNHTTEFNSRSDNDYDLIFVDTAPPSISDITWSPESFNHKKYIVVEAVIIDNGSGIISEAVLQYRVNEGSWVNQTMFNVEGDTYESILPRFDIGDRIEIRIAAFDSLGNGDTSDDEEFRISEGLIMGGFGILSALLILLLLVVIMNMIFSLKRRSYLKKRFTGSEIPESLSHLKKDSSGSGRAGGGR